MSRYVRSATETIEFDGDKVTVVIKPMTFVDCAKAINVRTLSSPAEVSELIGELLPKYVSSISGLRDAAGAEIGIDIVASDMYFSKLAGLILGSCVKISVLRDPQQPDEQSAPSSPG